MQHTQGISFMKTCFLLVYRFRFRVYGETT